jgi:DNA-binding response OmpR family regulator
MEAKHPLVGMSLESQFDPFKFFNFTLAATGENVPSYTYDEALTPYVEFISRRNGTTASNLHVGGLKLDRVKREVSWEDGSAGLSTREYRLLELLMRSPTHIFSRQQILRQVWDIGFDPQTNVVDVCVQRVKRKMEAGTELHGVTIESVRGVGYRMKLQGSDA